MEPEIALRRLVAAQYATADVMAAAGTLAGRFQQRFKETQGLPLSDTALDPLAKRRRFLLPDGYNLRLLEVLAAPSRLGVKAAVEIIKRAAGYDLDGNTFNLDGSPSPADEFSAFRSMRDEPPEFWPEAWRSRDTSAPWWVVAREYDFGWRVATRRDLTDAMAMLPQPETPPPGGSFAVIFNLTAELARVDQVLLASLDSKAGDA